jgi:hypothetical protein
VLSTSRVDRAYARGTTPLPAGVSRSPADNGYGRGTGRRPRSADDLWARDNRGERGEPSLPGRHGLWAGHRPGHPAALDKRPAPAVSAASRAGESRSAGAVLKRGSLERQSCSSTAVLERRLGSLGGVSWSTPALQERPSLERQDWAGAGPELDDAPAQSECSRRSAPGASAAYSQASIASPPKTHNPYPPQFQEVHP